MKTRPACASETNDRVVSAVYETFKASLFDLRVQPSLFPRAESRDTEPGTVEMRGRRNDTQDTAVTVTNFCGAGYSLLTASTSTEQTRLTFAVVLAPDRRRRRHTAQTSGRRSSGPTTSTRRDTLTERHLWATDGRLRRNSPAQRRARCLRAIGDADCQPDISPVPDVRFDDRIACDGVWNVPASRVSARSS